MSTLRQLTGRTDRRPRPADDRGVSEVLGAILIFGLVLALLVLLQASVVPVLNEKVEFEQSQRSQNDLEEFQAASFRAAASGNGETLSVESGARYPNRAFLVNPPPASGTLQTGDPLEVSLSNVTVAGEAGDYWVGTVTYESRPLVYTPGYREYTQAPTTVYEHSVLYNDFGEAQLTVNSGRIVSDDRITLLALSGEYDERSFRAVTLGLEPLSAPSNTVIVESTAASPLTITFETYRSETSWNDSLAAAIGTSIEQPVYTPAATGPSSVTLQFRPGLYELQMANVGIGDASAPSTPAYIADVVGGNTTIFNGQSIELTVEVRDTFNNPVSGVLVENEGTTAYGVLQSVAPRTDENGEARFRYIADATVGVDQLVFTYDTSSSDPVTKSTTLVRTAEIPPIVVGVVDGVSQINPSEPGTVILEDAGTTPGQSRTVMMTFNNTLAEPVVIESARLTYYLSGDGGATPTAGDINGTTLPVGNKLIPLAPNEVTLPASTASVVDITFNSGTTGQSDFYILTLEFRGQSTGGTFISTYFVTPT